MDLHEIANTPGFGTGKKARDIAHVKTVGRAMVGDPSLLATLYARETPQGHMVGSLGNCPETDADWFLEHESELGLIDGTHDTASNNAKAIAAVWNAYIDGDLVWVDDAQGEV